MNPVILSPAADAGCRLPEGIQSGWLRLALITFRRVERRLKVMRRLQDVMFCLLLASAAHIAFLLHRSPPQQGLWLALTLGAFLPSLAIFPLSWVATRRTRYRRHQLAAEFSRLGLRVDAHGRLVTDRAHSRVVVDLVAGADFASAQAAGQQPRRSAADC
jgi:hypothetical protein